MYTKAAGFWIEATNKLPILDKCIHYSTWAEPFITIKNEMVKSHLLTSAEVTRHLSALTTESGLLYTGLWNFCDGTRLRLSSISRRRHQARTNCCLTRNVQLRFRFGRVWGPCTFLQQGSWARRQTQRTLRHLQKQSAASRSYTLVLEPAGRTRTDGKQSDGVTVLPFERDMPITWEVTVIYTCSPSH